MKTRTWIILCFLLAVCAGAARADVIISEVMASNGFYESGHAWDWVELHNDGKETVSLSGWGLTDSKKDLYKFTFPDGAKLKGGAYLTVWCTGEANKTKGKGDTFYADYKISSKGETLRLTDRDGREACAVKMPEQYGCVSSGLPEGATFLYRITTYTSSVSVNCYLYNSTTAPIGVLQASLTVTITYYR